MNRPALPEWNARQAEVVRLVAYGLTNEQVAHRLQITYAVVGTLLSNAAAQLKPVRGVTRVGVVHWYLRHCPISERDAILSGAQP